jgi:hypothetical protein
MTATCFRRLARNRGADWRGPLPHRRQPRLQRPARDEVQGLHRRPEAAVHAGDQTRAVSTPGGRGPAIGHTKSDHRMAATSSRAHTPSSPPPAITSAGCWPAGHALVRSPSRRSSPRLSHQRYPACLTPLFLRSTQHVLHRRRLSFKLTAKSPSSRPLGSLGRLRKEIGCSFTPFQLRFPRVNGNGISTSRQIQFSAPGRS